MIKDALKSTGEVTLVITDSRGNQRITEKFNLVVDAGLNFITSRMKDATSSVMSHIAVGSSSTEADAADTSLGTQISDRLTLVSSTVVDNSITYVGTFGAGVCTGAITEAGIFNATTAGTMLARVVFPVINKGALDTLGITWTITHSAT